jgi:hypothetical protein
MVCISFSLQACKQLPAANRRMSRGFQDGRQPTAHTTEHWEICLSNAATSAVCAGSVGLLPRHLHCCQHCAKSVAARHLTLDIALYLM